jgi:Zn-dependent peptidase ImmA (M78 family)
VPDADLGQWSPALHAAIRRAREQQDVTLDLARLLGEELPERPRVNASPTDVETFAAAARELLGIPLEEQFEWSDRYTALNAWIGAVESTGTLVLQASRISVKEMRGFSIADHPVPVIVLNGGDAARGRIFTALHEFAHVLIEASGVCDLHDASKPRSPDDDVELRCNAIAASVLMPQAAFESDELLRGAPSNGVWPEHRIQAIADRYSVSQEATLRRLLSIGLTTWDYYRGMRQKYRRRYEAVAAARRQENKGGPPLHRMRVRDLGRPFVRLVLDAYYQDQINTSEVTDYLGVKVKSLPKIETEAFRTAA